MTELERRALMRKWTRLLVIALVILVLNVGLAVVNIAIRQWWALILNGIGLVGSAYCVKLGVYWRQQLATEHSA